jgi:hypothetical protein
MDRKRKKVERYTAVREHSLLNAMTLLTACLFVAFVLVADNKSLMTLI